MEEKKHAEEIQFLKRTNQQLKVPFVTDQRQMSSLDSAPITAVVPILTFFFVFLFQTQLEGIIMPKK